MDTLSTDVLVCLEMLLMGKVICLQGQCFRLTRGPGGMNFFAQWRDENGIHWFRLATMTVETFISRIQTASQDEIGRIYDMKRETLDGSVSST